jgi:hypothetical protein
VLSEMHQIGDQRRAQSNKEQGASAHACIVAPMHRPGVVAGRRANEVQASRQSPRSSHFQLNFFRVIRAPLNN